MSNYQDQDWVRKEKELLRQSDSQCAEGDCPVKAQYVHICYRLPDKKIWQLPEDAYKCYCWDHLKLRRNVEHEIRTILPIFSTNELDSLEQLIAQFAVILGSKRDQVIQQLRATVKNKYSDNYFYNESIDDSDE